MKFFLTSLFACTFFIFTPLAPVLAQENSASMDRSPSISKKYSDGATGTELLELYKRPAPSWVYDNLKKLNEAGYLSGIPYNDLTHLDRQEAAILTMRAHNNYSILNTNISNNIILAILQPLLKEFHLELDALGDSQSAQNEVKSTKTSTVNIWNIPKGKWDVYGEIRYSQMLNSSNNDRYNWNDQRIRARIYGDKPLDDIWMLRTMAETDKSLSSHNFYNKSYDGHVKLKRVYLKGTPYIGKAHIPVNTELGWTSAYLSEGNVLDSSFHGIKLSTNGNNYDDNTWLYSMGYGKINNDDNNLFYGELFYNASTNIVLNSNFYSWDNYGKKDNIYSASVNYYIKNTNLGFMFLNASEKDANNNGTGYVFTIRLGRNKSSILGTHELTFKYYDMAQYTYINHTMSGLCGYMNGFNGYGINFYYTIFPHVKLGIEYYDLKDKLTNDNIRTLWNEITYEF
ncbi:hypothetical protein [Pectinatus frisingensis]|uniref:hypothetical protein n=1 Tax=Pectinatus frisingensis TaxID=865 RepID=UPI0018C65B0E|nr:hypothetical protein [Pectinatus frisingensis]